MSDENQTETVETTALFWMEKNQLEVSQWSCRECEKIFHYANDVNDSIHPAFCPECGRKNWRKL